MEVQELCERDTEAWDEYVYNAPGATIYHLAGWKDVMESTFGLRCHYLFACDDSQILGVLPLLCIKSRLSGCYFTSMPSAICAQNENVARALFDKAKELVMDQRSKYLLLRDSYRQWDLPGVVTSDVHCTLIAQIGADQEQMWKAIDRRVRQHTRKAIKANLEVVVGPEHLEEFYPPYSRAMQALGTPTLGLKFFRKVMEQFPEHFTSLLVRYEDEALGGALVACFKDRMYNTWGGMLRESFKLRSCHIWYWETLKYGQENGFRSVDLGRSEWNSGTFNFKKHWLSEPQPLYQQCFLNGIACSPAVGSQRANDPKYRAFVKIWQKLPPAATEVLGPQLRRRMPFG